MAAPDSVVPRFGALRGDAAGVPAEGRSPRQMAWLLLVCIALTLSARVCIGDEPVKADDLIRRAYGRFRKDDCDGAIADVTRLIQLEPRNVDAYSARASFRRAKRDWAGAAADYTKCLELDPGNPYPPTFNRGQARRYAGESRGAVADFTRALELNPANRHVILVARALSNYDLGDLDSAIADCSSILEIRPEFVEMYRVRGLCRFARGAFPESLPDFRAVLERTEGQEYEPYWERVRAYLFVARMSMGQRAEAQDELRSFVARRAKSAPASWGAQLGAFLLGDATEADLMKAAEAGTPDEPAEEIRCEALLFVGLRHGLEGKTDPARAALKRCLSAGSKISREHTVATEFLKRM